MAKGVNKVIILGNVGNKEAFENVTKLSIATNESWKNKETGEKETATEWHKVVFFGKLAEIVNQYVEKGSQLYIEGKLQTKKYTSEDGTDRWTTDIIAKEMQMCGKSEGAKKPPQPNADAYDEDAKRYAKKYENKNEDDFLDDAPF